MELAYKYIKDINISFFELPNLQKILVLIAPVLAFFIIKAFFLSQGKSNHIITLPTSISKTEASQESKDFTDSSDLQDQDLSKDKATDSTTESTDSELSDIEEYSIHQDDFQRY